MQAAKAPYPAPTKNQKCWKISSPKLVDENLAKVELIVGKTQMADSNQHFLNGKLPTVIYTPIGYSVQCRIWQSNKKASNASLK